MIYIASPYTHPDPEVLEVRFRHAFDYANYLMQVGRACFSPIVYGHAFHLLKGAPVDYHWWQPFNDHMLITASEMHVLMLDGWRDSRGLSHELSFANANGIKTRLVEWPLQSSPRHA